MTLVNQVADEKDLQALLSFLRKNEITKKLMREHYEITRHRYDLIDDDESKFIEKPFNGFIAHRHSQSVLSILAKKINYPNSQFYQKKYSIKKITSDFINKI